MLTRPQREFPAGIWGPSQNKGEHEEPGLKGTGSREAPGTQKQAPAGHLIQPPWGHVGPTLLSLASLQSPGREHLGGPRSPPGGRTDPRTPDLTPIGNRSADPESGDEKVRPRDLPSCREESPRAHFLEAPSHFQEPLPP